MNINKKFNISGINTPAGLVTLIKNSPGYSTTKKYPTYDTSTYH